MSDFDSQHFESIENTITNHFIHLHGILQNYECQLKSKLYTYRNTIKKQINELHDYITYQAEKLTNAATVCTTLEISKGDYSIDKFVEVLLQLAETQCHIIEENVSNETIRMKIDDTIISKVKEHIQLNIPKIPEFKLVTFDEVPDEFKVELLPLIEEKINLKNAIQSKEDGFLPITQPPCSSNTTMNSSIVSSTDEEIQSSVTENDSLECVKVTYIKDPTDFYIQKISTSTLLDEAEVKIKDYVEKNTISPQKVYINRLYLVQSSVESKWYRARIIKILEKFGEETTCEVFYIDYGLTEAGIKLSQIRKSESSLNVMVGLAVHCTLMEIVPVIGEWKEDIVEQFKNMVTKNAMYMQILDASNPIISVDLRSKNFSITDWLIDTGLCKRLTYHKLKRMNPISAQQFYFEDLLLERYTLVKVTHIESPDCIYVQKVYNKEFQEKMALFNAHYANFQKLKDLTILCPEYGNTVAYNDSPFWHRGIITKICADESKVHVFLVDHGSTEIVDYSKIKHLPSRFCTWNAQAIQVSLKNVKPIGNKWPVETINYMKKMLIGKKINFIAFSKSQKNYNGHIYLRNNKNLSYNLIGMNLAQGMGNHLKCMSLRNDSKRVTNSQISIYKKAMCSEQKNKTPFVKNQESPQTVEDTDPFKVRVVIKKVITPDEIYVSEVSINAVYQNMIAKMQKFYQKNLCSSNCKLILHNYYCVYSIKDKQYLRGELLEILDGEPLMTKMLLIDLCEIENIPVEQIQLLDSRFFKVSRNVFTVKLAGIRPCGGTSVWQSSSCEKLNEIINDNGDTKYYITLINTPNDDYSIYVDLCIRRYIKVGPTEPNKKETLSVGRRLVEEGLALPIRGYSEQEDKELGIELLKKLQLDFTCSDSTEPLLEENQISNLPNFNSKFSMVNNAQENKIINNVQDINHESIENELMESQSLKMKNWIPNNYTLKKSFFATFTYIDYDCAVYFHVNSKECIDTVKYITDTLNTYYENRKIKKCYNWKKGDLCHVNYHADKKWYRGKVVEAMSAKHLKILFVDYGNIEECEVYNVDKQIILQDIPIQCIKATIMGLKPRDTKWKEYDLDIIHKLIVTRSCKVSVAKLSRPISIAIWIPIENSSFYPLPLYLINNTQVRCCIEDITKYYSSDDNSENIDNTNSDLNSSIYSDLQVTVVNQNNVNGLINQIEDINIRPSNSKSSTDTDKTLTNTHSFDLLENNQDTELEITQISQDNLSTTISSSMSKTSSKIFNSSNNLPLEIQDEEEQIIKFGDENMDDAESISTEVMLNDLENAKFVSSTPIDNFIFYEMTSENSYNILFDMYKIRSFQMNLGQAFTETEMTGYITNSSNKELNQWIIEFNKLQEEIQNDAEKQPIFSINSGEYCIAKYEDGLWYRAFALQIGIDDGSVYVEFIDFGNRDIILDNKKVREIKDEWFDIPWMSFHFKLYNVQPVYNRREELQKAFVDIFGSLNKFTVIIRKYKPTLEMELYLDEECKQLAYASLLQKNLLEIIV